MTADFVPNTGRRTSASKGKKHFLVQTGYQEGTEFKDAKRRLKTPQRRFKRHAGMEDINGSPTKILKVDLDLTQSKSHLVPKPVSIEKKLLRQSKSHLVPEQVLIEKEWVRTDPAVVTPSPSRGAAAPSGLDLRILKEKNSFSLQKGAKKSNNSLVDKVQSGSADIVPFQADLQPYSPSDDLANGALDLHTHDIQTREENISRVGTFPRERTDTDYNLHPQFGSIKGAPPAVQSTSDQESLSQIEKVGELMEALIQKVIHQLLMGITNLKILYHEHVQEFFQKRTNQAAEVGKLIYQIMPGRADIQAMFVKVGKLISQMMPTADVQLVQKVIHQFAKLWKLIRQIMPERADVVALGQEIIHQLLGITILKISFQEPLQEFFQKKTNQLGQFYRQQKLRVVRITQSAAWACMSFLKEISLLVLWFLTITLSAAVGCMSLLKKIGIKIGKTVLWYLAILMLLMLAFLPRKELFKHYPKTISSNSKITGAIGHSCNKGYYVGSVCPPHGQCQNGYLFCCNNPFELALNDKEVTCELPPEFQTEIQPYIDIMRHSTMTNICKKGFDMGINEMISSTGRSVTKENILSVPEGAQVLLDKVSGLVEEAQLGIEHRPQFSISDLEDAAQIKGPVNAESVFEEIFELFESVGESKFVLASAEISKLDLATECVSRYSDLMEKRQAGE